MTQERIELRFSPGNPTEKALIEALTELGDEYGAKGRFLKTRLLKGFTTILDQLDGLMGEGDPRAALDRLSSSIDAKHYRVLKVMLLARLSPGQGGEDAPEVGSVPIGRVERFSSAGAGVTMAAQQIAHPGSIDGPPAGVPVVGADAARVGVQDVPSRTDVLDADAPPPVASDDDVPAVQASVEQTVVPVPPAAAPRPNWGNFKGIAGVKKGP
jgi:hypothetical protein